MNITLKDKGFVLQAISKKFADVPRKGIAHGAVLKNRGRLYINEGNHLQTIWKPLKQS